MRHFNLARNATSELGLDSPSVDPAQARPCAADPGQLSDMAEGAAHDLMAEGDSDNTRTAPPCATGPPDSAYATAAK
jgi:hypothetical protein